MLKGNDQEAKVQLPRAFDYSKKARLQLLNQYVGGLNALSELNDDNEAAVLSNILQSKVDEEIVQKNKEDRAREIAERCMALDEELDRLVPSVEKSRRDMIGEIDDFVSKVE